MKYLTLPHNNAYTFAAAIYIIFHYFISKFFINGHNYFCTYSVGIFGELRGLSDGRVVCLIKNEYCSAVHFLWSFIEVSMKYLKSVSIEWLTEIYWSSCMVWVFIIKQG